MSVDQDEFDFDNYDGQGKTREEETDATLRMLAFLMIGGLVVGGVVLLALVAWLLTLIGR